MGAPVPSSHQAHPIAELCLPCCAQVRQPRWRCRRQAVLRLPVLRAAVQRHRGRAAGQGLRLPRQVHRRHGQAGAAGRRHAMAARTATQDQDARRGGGGAHRFAREPLLSALPRCGRAALVRASCRTILSGARVCVALCVSPWQGIGRKVASCVALMCLDKYDDVPVCHRPTLPIGSLRLPLPCRSRGLSHRVAPGKSPAPNEPAT